MRIHSAIEPPIIKIYQLTRFKIGKARSRAPIMIGIRKLPITAGIDGTRKKKIITTPCMVNRRLYASGENSTSPLGVISSSRITVAAAPPTKKNAVIAAMYSSPIRL
jgi:hypothetical protein